MWSRQSDPSSTDRFSWILQDQGRFIMRSHMLLPRIYPHRTGFYTFYHLFTQLVLHEEHPVETELCSGRSSNASSHSLSSKCRDTINLKYSLHLNSVGNYSPNCAGILEQSIGAEDPSRNRVIELARQTTHRLAESIPWNGFLGSLLNPKFKKYRICLLLPFSQLLVLSVTVFF
jgi:hypothetical protein